MPRIVSVWLPAWPIQRLARARRRAGLAPPWGETGGPAPAFALVESGVRGLTLTAVNARAWRDGLRPGLALADARAALPALLTAPAEPEQDRAALAAVAAWAGRYGPARNAEGSDGVWIDTGGVAHLFGGEPAMLEDLRIRLAKAGISARIGLADTPAAAFALARYAATSQVPARIAMPGTSREALAALPVEALRLPPATTLLLGRLGLRRIGLLHALPREALAQRFRAVPAGRGGTRSGARRREREAALMAGIVLARLDQAVGLAPEPREPLAEPPRHIARALFAEPLVTAAGVEAAIEALAHDLERLLEARGEGGTRFALDLFRADGSAQQVLIGASRPCRDALHLIALLTEKLDRIDAGFGIDAATLACTHAELLGARQVELLSTGAAISEAGTAALLDRLSNRLGAARVLRLAAADSHIPERAQRRVPALVAAAPAAAPQIALRVPRPAFLLAAPEPIAVLAEVPEGPPRQLTWRRLVHRIVRAEGPERIEPEWWRAIGRRLPRSGPQQSMQLARPRDYYRVEDEHGGRFWVFRAGLYGREETDGEGEATPRAPSPAWFMHGVIG